MTEEQERAAFKDWYESQPNGYSDPWEGWKARAALSQPASPAPEASRHHIIAEFLESSGQYVTNDATREAAIAEATSAARQLALEAIDSIEEWSMYAPDYHKKMHGLAEQIAAYRERLAGLTSPAAPISRRI